MTSRAIVAQRLKTSVKRTLTGILSALRAPQPDPTSPLPLRSDAIALRLATMTPNAPPPKTPADWKAIERAATAELQERTMQAHARIVALLEQHAAQFDERQRKRVRRLLKRGD